jgi:hypothetical protein
MDADDDGEIDVPQQENPVRTKAICWSYGKPENASDHKSAKQNEPGDWLASWK